MEYVIPTTLLLGFTPLTKHGALQLCETCEPGREGCCDFGIFFYRTVFSSGFMVIN